MPRRSSFFSFGRTRHRRPGHIDPRRHPGAPGSIEIPTLPLMRPEESIPIPHVHVISYGAVEGSAQPVAAAALVASKPEAEKVLTVTDVDVQASINGLKHHTDKYAITSSSQANPLLVARRGQPFNLIVQFNRAYNPKTDDLKFVVETGNKPLPSKKTYVEFVLSEVDKPGEWGAKQLYSKDNSIAVEVYTPPDCYVAKWTFKIDVIKQEKKEISVYRYVHADPFYIIFNPWCKEDSVYMDDEKLLKEYVLSEIGRLYAGTSTSITYKPWNFGQFESIVLDVAMYLLEVGDLNWAVRGNVVAVTRSLSALINSPDEGGVLTGNWTGNYEGGTSPLSWTGSVPILDEFWKTKRPVNYGQCWVFAGVLATVCRTLGIPTRCVTNFSSAHDTDGSITIDIHMKADGEMDTENNLDSVWTFHVWNECWMARPDLPHGYGGWQVVDSTPQEASDGLFCCGPASVTAIKNGDVHLPHDGPFVFAEINSDTAYWVPNKLGVLECVYMNTKAVGKFISTMSVTSGERQDITHEYKHSEGSPEERAAVLKANQVGSTRHDMYKTKANDTKFTIVLDPENSWIGGDFVVDLKMKNISKEKRTVGGRINVCSEYYTGVLGDKLKSEPFKNIVIPPGKEKVYTVTVTQDEYSGKLKDGYILDVSVWAYVKETQQTFVRKEDARLRKPHLTADVPSEAILNTEFKIDVSFANPLNSSLTGCVVTVDGVCKAIKFPQGNVSPNGTFMASLPITPDKLGSSEVIIIFNSVQLEDINTSRPITVREA